MGALGIRDGWAGVAWRLAGAALLVAWGEALRRGARAAWAGDVVLMLGLSAGGVAQVIALLAGHRSVGGVVAAALMLTFAPWAAAGLLDPRTRAWVRSPAGPPPRLRGAWLAPMIAWSIAFGVLVAWSQSA